MFEKVVATSAWVWEANMMMNMQCEQENILVIQNLGETLL